MVEPLEFPSCDPASSAREPVSKAATHAAQVVKAIAFFDNRDFDEFWNRVSPKP
jgi:hypothetical protein